MKIGEQIEVRAYKADGTCYRRWEATVEEVETDQLVVITPAGHRVKDIEDGWISKYAIRALYSFDRWYSLLEMYAPDGSLGEIYVNIGSPAQLEGSVVRFTDYELDVSRRPPLGAHLEDEKEFREGAS